MGDIKKIIFFFLVVATSGFLVYPKMVAATVPILKEGTYLSGQTLSVWPSWSLLGNALGQALPVDPVNELAPAGTCEKNTNVFCTTDANCPSSQVSTVMPGKCASGICVGVSRSCVADSQCPFTTSVSTVYDKCILHDPNTGWSTADRRFSFACNRASYAYRYIVSTSSNNYIVRTHFEDPGFTPANFNNFVAGFISSSIFKINESSGICLSYPEISTMQSGVCGDSVLNSDRGEQCDPPGRIEYQAGCVGTTKNLTVCNNNCQWVASTTLCSNFRKCGNGIVEGGETCDDGNLNGKYNHCNTTCNGISALGKCGDNVVQSAYEVCDVGTPGVAKYSLTSKQNSCSWDCQNWGPYCGNNITEAQYGEECDGSLACSVNGHAGMQICGTNCKQQSSDVAAWWSFQNSSLVDSSGNNNNGSCTGATCPTFGQARYGKGAIFNNSQYFSVPGAPSINISSSISVEAWVNPTDYSTLRQRVVEKGAAAYGYWYGLEVNAVPGGTARFNFSDYSNFSVDSKSVIPTNTWTHLVGTFERIGQTNYMKIYVNGNLDNSKNFFTTTQVNGVGWAPLSVGASRTDRNNDTYANFFSGTIDEVKIYRRVLSSDEVMSDYQSSWPCVVPTSTAVNNQPGVCGNGVVDTNEACDRGVAENGKTCTPTYGQSCSYCSADCQNTIDVQPSQYCGNGIIEDSEKCDQSSGVIYAAAANPNSTLSTKDVTHNGYQELACSNEPTDPHTIKVGTKDCSNCSIATVSNCIKCGMDPNGVSVGGGLINVLQNQANPDPLFSQTLQTSAIFPNSSTLDLAIGPCYYITISAGNYKNICNTTMSQSPDVGRDTKNDSSRDLTNYVLQNPYSTGDALVNSDPSCSSPDPANKHYTMYINKDWARPFDFSVVSQPQPWQYDMVLSPVVLKSNRNQDVRVVVSWVGPDDFYGGFLNPYVSPYEITDASFCDSSGACADSTGLGYFNSTNKYGVWYHGFNSTVGQTNAEAFTINTADMSGNTYSFFVKTPSSPIRQFKNTAKLKVEVYLPENDSAFWLRQTVLGQGVDYNKYRFGTPAKTYYLLGATPSDNQNAKYWQVFNINQPVATTTVSSTDIIDVSSIVTGPAYFEYVPPLAP